MVKEMTLLGSTGSIGRQTLEICKMYGIKINALAAYSNIELLEKQARQFNPKMIVIVDKNKYSLLKENLRDTPVSVLSGEDALEEIAASPNQDEILVNAVVGMAGLVPTLAAISAGKSIALANKETLVAGGDLVMKNAAEKGVKILPVDSEHSAIFQSLGGNRAVDQISKIILTASGGPFFGKNRDELIDVGLSDALNHPNWSMGKKITIDSATMMNKGLEVIEAVHLFGKSADDIEVVVHRESVVHSAVEFCDGSVIAQLGKPDMAIPIQYALSYPDRFPTNVGRLSLTDYGTLSFYKPDLETFSALATCIEAINIGGLAPCVVNAINEVAVALFLENKIGFLEISEMSKIGLENINLDGDNLDIKNILAADKSAREYAISLFEKRKNN